MVKHLTDMSKKKDVGPGFAKQFKWQLRHIVVHHKSKTIMIQVGHTAMGDLDWAEFQAINAGNYERFFPNDVSRTSIEIRNELRKLIAAGYTVEPIFFQGVQNENGNFAVLQLTELRDGRPKTIDLNIG